MSQGKIVTGTVSQYDIEGNGILKNDNRTILVPGVLLNEKIEVDVSASIPRIVKIIEKSKNRTEPKCKLYSKCGGCNLQHISYTHQLEMKTMMVQELFQKEFHKTFSVKPCIGMRNPYEYRNKNQIVFGNDRKEKIISGFYEEKTHKIINFDRCLIQDEKSDKIVATIKDIMIKLRLYAYDEDRKSGLIRHVMIKRSFKTDETMVIIVTASDIFPGRSNFLKMLLARHKEITTVIQNINTRKTSAVLGDKELILYGKGYIIDHLCGMKFKVSSKSFYQVNPSQAEVLYQKAIDLANFSSQDTLLDAYSGVGTIGLIASSKVKRVISVEKVNEAHQDAIFNAKINNVKNIHFFNDDATKFIINVARKKEKIDVVIMDPPRSGSDTEFMKALLQLKPEKIVYISCNPVTQVEDLKLMLNDYQIKDIQPVDMFPQTIHVESVVLLVRK